MKLKHSSFAVSLILASVLLALWSCSSSKSSPNTGSFFADGPNSPCERSCSPKTCMQNSSKTGYICADIRWQTQLKDGQCNNQNYCGCMCVDGSTVGMCIPGGTDTSDCGDACAGSCGTVSKACVQGNYEAYLGSCTYLYPDSYFLSDPNNCGSQGHICSGTQPGCCGGGCTDLTNDNANCGACGNVCSEVTYNNSGIVTQTSTCAASSQGAGYCQGLSQDTGWQSNENFDDAFKQCDGSYCGCLCRVGGTQSFCSFDNLTCPSKCSEECGGIASCAAYTWDNFLTACQTLYQGGGNLSCPSGYQSCGGRCVYTLTDPNNCGGCGNGCSNTQYCSGGSIVSCPAGTTRCGGSCIDLQSSNNNCGQCGNKCPSGATCNNGQCPCPDNQTNCSGSCRNLSTDSNNCGSCGTKCPLGVACTNGSCKCPTSQVNCSGGCTNLNSDSSNCGSCGTQCAVGGSCTNGICKCPDNQVNCSGTCADLNTDSNNCGSCGNYCYPTSLSCSSGSCVQPTN